VTVNAGKDESASMKKQLIFNPRTWDLKEFEDLARQAKDAGFTHIVISELAERTDFQGEDKDSPWCEWSAILPSVFKHYTPKGMEEAYPQDFVQRQMAFMKAKHKIVEKLDMRAAYYGTEPHWLNERVYRKHPQWRGSRADNSLRTTGMYFAPNTDHPEVREMYRTAIREIVKACPRLDFFFFNTNDSGGFYPWDKRLFSGPNGPTGYEGRDMGKRVAEFLKYLRQGALDAGVDAKVFTNVYGWFNDDETHLVLRSLEPGIGVANGAAPEPYTAECSLLGCGGWGGCGYFPAPLIEKYPTPSEVVAGVASVKTHPSLRFVTGGNATEYFQAFKALMDMPPAVTPRLKLEALYRIASAVYAPDVADELVEAWQIMEKAQTMTSTAMVPLFDVVALRWLTRPLVAHQELLSDEEKAYWVPYIYQSQASQPDTWLDYVNGCGYRIVDNWEEAGRVCCAIDGIERTLGAAAAKLETAAQKTADREVAARIQVDALRVRVQRCLVLTCRHYVQMGTLIYLRDAQNAAAPKTTTTGGDKPSMPKGDLGSHGLWYMHRAMRWELDNTYDLIDLLKKSPVRLFFTAPHPSFTGPLLLEPNVLESLEKKVDIMLRHWRDAEIGYYRPTLGG